MDPQYNKEKVAHNIGILVYTHLLWEVGITIPTAGNIFEWSPPEASAKSKDHEKMLPRVGTVIATDQERWVYDVHHAGGAKVPYKSPLWSGKIIKKIVCSGSF